jgi:hypothetical protein
MVWAIAAIIAQNQNQRKATVDIFAFLCVTISVLRATTREMRLPQVRTSNAKVPKAFAKEREVMFFVGSSPFPPALSLGYNTTSNFTAFEERQC